MKACKLFLRCVFISTVIISCHKKNSDNNSCNCQAMPFAYVDATNRFYLATVFSPNNDGLNDLFRFITAQPVTITNFLITIYRGNQAIYQSTDPSFAWDGMDQFNQLIPGKYRVDISFNSSANTSYSGCMCVVIPAIGGSGCIMANGSQAYFEDQILANGTFSPVTSERLCP